MRCNKPPENMQSEHRSLAGRNTKVLNLLLKKRGSYPDPMARTIIPINLLKRCLHSPRLPVTAKRPPSLIMYSVVDAAALKKANLYLSIYCARLVSRRFLTWLIYAFTYQLGTEAAIPQITLE